MRRERPECSDSEEYSPAFDFLHHLYDTVILLGGKKEIADLVKKSMDCAVNEEDIKTLRRYNTELITQAKDRLAHINKMRIRTRSARRPN